MAISGAISDTVFWKLSCQDFASGRSERGTVPPSMFDYKEEKGHACEKSIGYITMNERLYTASASILYIERSAL